jgi:type VI protein secretion system component VasF
MERDDSSIPVDRDQHAALTLDRALTSLELALRNLEDGPAERRVRRQFHQLLLAIERFTRPADDPNLGERLQ